MNRLLLVCVFIAAATAAVMGQLSCPSGYTLRPGGNCYKLWTLQDDWWLLAEHHCQAEGASLATIRNDADSVWINNFFIDNRRHHCWDWYWLGANDLSQEGVWRWQDGSKVTYTNWTPGEPNNNGGEDVLEVNSKNRMWNDNSVTHTGEACFVCERKPIGSCDC